MKIMCSHLHAMKGNNKLVLYLYIERIFCETNKIKTSINFVDSRKRIVN